MNLKSRYMGLELEHPVVASASPLSETLDGIRRLEDGGAAAIVLFSLFEEQIRRENAAFERLLAHGTHSFAESLSYFPDIPFAAGPDDYLELVRRARESAAVPIIASLNCVTGEGWVEYARQLEQAGACGLEINLYAIEADPGVTGQAVEQRYLDVLALVKGAVSIPVALKLSPFFSAFGHLATQLDQAGADALVLFNRFYQPDIDLATLEVAPTLSLSNPEEIRLPLLWIALLHGRLKASLGASRGVESSAEVIKYLLAGADAVMTTSALLRHGPSHCGRLVAGLRTWMEARGFESVAQLRGRLSRSRVADPGAFERANYLKILESYR
ncbi:dihydroorotate dehydrogenase-like protein [Candidatus Methylocalor cossyra]|uniref:Dihydropyrimidine dehydrogenase (NADP+), similar to dihydroorotate dehydrogenase n=1 Tax=Candidatus Methylocalor cossyra TaxID=3108543 RepID=A0ABP1C8T6_9GAMM